ncbi:hypothetical protein JAK43_13970 [Stenotrophomonas maltophilia]|uniref:hypothetical protein n=2 Tax=Stenotrophomonas maltophilia TaxID=40324 RepID=UPI002E760863|nr:hypothetical protein [Stenotrophomonas maltophilia]MCU1150979.1 hypothetical protein [Stenotrophomonas maltophilia]
MMMSDATPGFRRRLGAGLALTLALCLFAPLKAEPSGDNLTILSLRPYIGGTAGVVYVHVSSMDLCSTDIFTIDMSMPGAKEAYAAALAALTSGKKVRLEVLNSTGCNGWATGLQSVTIRA